MWHFKDVNLKNVKIIYYKQLHRKKNIFAISKAFNILGYKFCFCGFDTGSVFLNVRVCFPLKTGCYWNGMIMWLIECMK